MREISRRRDARGAPKIFGAPLASRLLEISRARACVYFRPPHNVEGDRAGDREKRGREVYGRGEKRGWEAGEKGEDYATLRNISQSKKCKGAGAKKYRAGTGIKGYGKREI